MKKILFLSFFLIGLNNASAQNYYMTHPEGFGAAATGGGAPTVSNTVTVDTYDEFKTAIKASGAKVILVSGNITFSSAQLQISEQITDKTIIGLPGAKLVNDKITITSTPPSLNDCSISANNSGILNIKPGSDNIIIRNLIFEGPGAFDVDGKDLLTNEGTNVWVDHCEFRDGMDGNFDNKGKADNVTVSWCKFTYLKPAISGGSGGSDDHRYSDLIGSDKTDSPADGNYSITFQNCYWADGCKERMPRARNSELHLLNCYYNTNVASSLALGLGGGDNNTTCYVENTNFAKISTVFKSYINKKDGSIEDGGTVGLAFDGCLNNSNPNIGTVSKPTYSYTVLPVAKVATYVSNASCGAGATLQVSASGVISTNCPNLDVKTQALNMGKLYPTAVDAILNIDLSDSISGNAVVNIFSINGNKVLSYSKNNVSASDKLSFNVANLSKGIYLCQIRIGDRSTTWKFIKK